MSEPVAIAVLPTQVLQGITLHYTSVNRGVGEPVVIDNVALREVAGTGGEVRAVVGAHEGGETRVARQTDRQRAEVGECMLENL